MYISRTLCSQTLKNSVWDETHLKNIKSWKRDANFELSRPWFDLHGLYGFTCYQTYDFQVAVDICSIRETRSQANVDVDYSLCYPRQFCDTDVVAAGHRAQIHVLVHGNSFAEIHVFEKHAELAFFCRPDPCPYPTKVLWKQVVERVCGFGPKELGKGLQLKQVVFLDWSLFPSTLTPSRSLSEKTATFREALGTILPFAPTLVHSCALPLSLRWFRYMSTGRSVYEHMTPRQCTLVNGIATVSKQQHSKCQSSAVFRACVLQMQQTNVQDLFVAIEKDPNIQKVFETLPYQIQRAFGYIRAYIDFLRAKTVGDLCSQVDASVQRLVTLCFIGWTNVPFIFVNEEETLLFYKQQQHDRDDLYFEPNLCAYTHPMEIASPLLRQWFVCCQIMWKMDMYKVEPAVEEKKQEPAATILSLQPSSGSWHRFVDSVFETYRWKESSHEHPCRLLPVRLARGWTLQNEHDEWICSVWGLEGVVEMVVCSAHWKQLDSWKQTQVREYLDECLKHIDRCYVFVDAGSLEEETQVAFEQNLLPCLNWKVRVSNGVFAVPSLYGMLYQNADWYAQCWLHVESQETYRHLLQTEELCATPAVALDFSKTTFDDMEYKAMVWALRSAFLVFEASRL